MLWQLTGQDDHRQHAAELYRAAYPRTPNAAYRQRIEALSGEPPEQPSLPPPATVAQRPEDLNALLNKVDMILAGLAQGPPQ